MARQPSIIIAIWTGAGGRNTAQIRDGRGRVLIRRMDFTGVWGSAAGCLWRVRSYLETPMGRLPFPSAVRCGVNWVLAAVLIVLNPVWIESGLL